MSDIQELLEYESGDEFEMDTEDVTSRGQQSKGQNIPNQVNVEVASGSFSGGSQASTSGASTSPNKKPGTEPRDRERKTRIPILRRHFRKYPRQFPKCPFQSQVRTRLSYPPSICIVCRKQGLGLYRHERTNCPVIASHKNQKGERVCFRCKLTGHVVSQCPN